MTVAGSELISMLREADAWRAVAEAHVADQNTTGTLARALVTVLDWADGVDHRQVRGADGDRGDLASDVAEAVRELMLNDPESTTWAPS